MSNKIVKFYKKDAAIDPDAVLEQAVGNYSSVVIVGWDKNGNLDAMASLNLTHMEVNWLISAFQQKLLNGDYGQEE